MLFNFEFETLWLCAKCKFVWESRRRPVGGVKTATPELRFEASIHCQLFCYVGFSFVYEVFLFPDSWVTILQSTIFHSMSSIVFLTFNFHVPANEPFNVFFSGSFRNAGMTSSLGKIRKDMINEPQNHMRDYRKNSSGPKAGYKYTYQTDVNKSSEGELRLNLKRLEKRTWIKKGRSPLCEKAWMESHRTHDVAAAGAVTAVEPDALWLADVDGFVVVVVPAAAAGDFVGAVASA